MGLMTNNSNTEVRKVLLFLKNMVYESTSPLETLRFARYYRRKELDVIVVLWGPMGVILGKKGKEGGLPLYDTKIKECIDLGVQFKCCSLGAGIIGLKKEELIEGIEMIRASDVAELFLEYHQPGHMVISL